MNNKVEQVNGDEPRKALRPKEAAARWAISKATLYKLIKSGKIPSISVGLPGCRCSRLIPIKELDQYFEQRQKLKSIMGKLNAVKIK